MALSAGTPRWLSYLNGYVAEPTGVAVSFMRQAKKFKVRQYVQSVETKKPIGIYLRLDPDNGVRIGPDGSDNWPDGQRAPEPTNTTGKFTPVPFQTQRKTYPYAVGYEQIENTDAFKARNFFDAEQMSKCMTAYTKQVADLLTATGNWGNNTASATTLSGGKGTWDSASNDPNSPYYLAIQKAIQKAARIVHLATNGVVSIDELRLILNPELAGFMAESPEIHAYLEKQEKSLEVIEGNNPAGNTWMLPKRIAGIEIVVEDAVYTPSLPTADGADATDKQFVWPDNMACLVSTSGGLSGEYGEKSYSTVQKYWHNYEVAVEAFDEPKHKRVYARVVDDRAVTLTAPLAGFLITSCK